MSSIQRWMSFFLEAGIPDVTAATYATNFTNNRIEMSMLLDLNKDYLKDLGITLLGDIIQILKHAKQVSEKHTSERVLRDKSEGRTGESTVDIKKLKKEPALNRKTDEIPEQQVKKIIKIKPGNSEPRKQQISNRLGPIIKEESETKSSVFKRLGEVEDSKDAGNEMKTVSRRVYSAKNEDEEEKGYVEELERVKTNKTARQRVISTKTGFSSRSVSGTIRHKQEEDRNRKPSAFDRLDEPDTTQVCRVSSTNEPGEVKTSRGILKQRGVKTGIQRSKSESNIISLKPQETVKKKARVSFGENDVRCMSPRAGVKSRLGIPGQDDEEDSDEEEENYSNKSKADLRQSLLKNSGKTIATGILGRSTSPETDMITRETGFNETKPEAPKTKKKFYVLRTMSDGTKQKVEVDENHPAVRKLMAAKEHKGKDSSVEDQVKRNEGPVIERNMSGITRKVNVNSVPKQTVQIRPISVRDDSPPSGNRFVSPEERRTVKRTSSVEPETRSFQSDREQGFSKNIRKEVEFVRIEKKVENDHIRVSSSQSELRPGARRLGQTGPSTQSSERFRLSRSHSLDEDDRYGYEEQSVRFRDRSPLRTESRRSNFLDVVEQRVARKEMEVNKLQNQMRSEMYERSEPITFRGGADAYRPIRSEERPRSNRYREDQDLYSAVNRRQDRGAEEQYERGRGTMRADQQHEYRTMEERLAGGRRDRSRSPVHRAADDDAWGQRRSRDSYAEGIRSRLGHRSME